MILDVVKEVFFELGFGVMIVCDIIWWINFVFGIFYNYFLFKEEIFEVFLDESVLCVWLKLYKVCISVKIFDEFIWVMF